MGISNKDQRIRNLEASIGSQKAAETIQAKALGLHNLAQGHHLGIAIEEVAIDLAKKSAALQHISDITEDPEIRITKN